MGHDISWSRFLSWWCLAVAGLALLLIGLFFVATPINAPLDRAELIGAVQRPFAHRLDATVDSAVWLGIGGVLLAFGSLIGRAAPLRSTLVIACGVGQLIGSTGGLIRFAAVDGLAARYAEATPAQQASLVQTYSDLSNVFGSMFGIGALLYGAGFILISSVLLSARAFPRWLAIWIGVSGLYPVAQRALAVVGIDLRPYFIGYFILGQIALFVAIGIYLWRRSLTANQLAHEGEVPLIHAEP